MDDQTLINQANDLVYQLSTGDPGFLALTQEIAVDVLFSINASHRLGMTLDPETVRILWAREAPEIQNMYYNAALDHAKTLAFEQAYEELRQYARQ
jgi:hypothetical protein